MSEFKRGPSISAKLIVVTMLLVLFVVAGVGFLNIRSIETIYDENAQSTQADLKQSLQEVGVAILGTAATSSRTYFEQSNDADLRVYIASLGKENPKIEFIYVLDMEYGLTADSDVSKNPEGEHPKVTRPSWQPILAEWKKRAAAGDPSTVISSMEFSGVNGNVALFASPVFPAGKTKFTPAAIVDSNAEVRPYGYVVIGYGLTFLEEAMAILQKKKAAAQSDAQSKTLLVGLGFGMFGCLLAVFQGLRMSRPVKALATRAEEISNGHLEARVDVKSSDEIGHLGFIFNRMTDRLVKLIEETARAASIEKEMEAAGMIQEALVPSTEAVNAGGLQLVSHFQPASHCGGDWWSYKKRKDGTVLIVVADVTGHGVPAAIITAAAIGGLEMVEGQSEKAGPGEILTLLNDVIHTAGSKHDMKMTCHVSIFDPKLQTVSFANAGHNPPFVAPPSNGAPRTRLGVLLATGPRLGERVGVEFPVETQKVEPGSYLLWYTDGLFECVNSEDQQWGDRALRKTLQSACIGDASPQKVRDEIIGAMNEFIKERPLDDDVTMVLGRFDQAA